MKPNKKKVGERIREIRTDLGYSMEEFGRLIGDSPRSSVNNWEKGVSIPKRDKLEKIAILGKMLPDQVLYGKADEYLYDLFDQNLNVRFSNNILYEIFESIPPEQRSYNDMMWLFIGKYFLDNGRRGKKVGTYTYQSMLGIPNLYTAGYRNDFIEQREDYTKQNVHYYIYADKESNVLHVIPFTPNDSLVNLFYEYPDVIEKKEEHQIFTQNFDEIGLTLKNSRIIYYGIDKQKMEPHIQSFVFDTNSNIYREIKTTETFPMFVEELDKKIEQLKAN
ncbi:helix-turn-helix domain-containing protein [Enterococcus sp. DIV1420a]|uniref:helix-turn-helix domain-containing protein n=1 Tax=Enterococcus sp. DIV1420a TaxID=2774672 RepID=UPI0036D70D59